MITCTSTAFPQPEFQWILQSSGAFFPESSWISLYHEKTAYSTLMYTFTTLDFEGSSTVVVCRATNAYGASEQFFTLKLNSALSSEQFFTLNNSASSISGSRAPLTPTLRATNGSGNDGRKQDGFETILAIVNGAIAAVACTILLLLIVLLLLKYLLRRKRK